MRSLNFHAESERKLIHSAQKNRRNFDPLYRKYYPVVAGYIRKRVENKELTEDLASKTFEKALKGLDNFQWQGVSFSAWLFRIARNVLNDYFRSRKRRPADVSWDVIQPFIEDKGIKPDEQVIMDEDELKLYQIMAKLEKEDQYLLYYKFFEGLTNVKIARITGLSETNVGTRLYRIRGKMKEFLERCDKL